VVGLTGFVPEGEDPEHPVIASINRARRIAGAVAPEKLGITVLTVI
jgi:hypothetical protein